MHPTCNVYAVKNHFVKNTGLLQPYWMTIFELSVFIPGFSSIPHNPHPLSLVVPKAHTFFCS